MKTYKSQSDIKPNDLDINVDTVYHNYNMVEKTNENGIYYEYDVDEYTTQEYIVKELEQNTKSIDDIVISMLGE